MIDEEEDTQSQADTDRYTQIFPPFTLDNEKPLQPHSSDDNGELYISGVPVKSSAVYSPVLASLTWIN